MRRNRSTLLVLVFVLCSQLLVHRADSKKPEPIWELDLTKFGFQTPESVSTSGRRDLSLWANARGVAFTSNDSLAAYFETRLENVDLSSRDELRPTDPYHLHALFVKPDQLEVLAQGDWPVRPSSPSYFFATKGANFIVGDGEALSLYSADRSLTTRLKMPWLGAASFKYWSAQISPYGDTVLVEHGVGSKDNYGVQFDLYDASDLSLLKSWTTTNLPPVTLWGLEIAWSKREIVYLQRVGSEPKTLAQASGGWCGPPSFVNEKVLFVGCGSRHLLVSTSGTIVNEVEIGSVGVAAPGAVPSRDGTTFAVPTFVPGLFDNPTPRKMTVKVYKIGNPKPILLVDIPPRGGWGGIALSPKADLLAVGTGQFVRVYRIPQ